MSKQSGVNSQLPLYEGLDIVLIHRSLRPVEPEAFRGFDVAILVKLGQSLLAVLGDTDIIVLGPDPAGFKVVALLSASWRVVCPRNRPSSSTMGVDTTRPGMLGGASPLQGAAPPIRTGYERDEGPTYRLSHLISTGARRDIWQEDLQTPWLICLLLTLPSLKEAWCRSALEPQGVVSDMLATKQ